jgi:diguanylate cyclase (GGDEF)-like protein
MQTSRNRLRQSSAATALFALDETTMKGTGLPGGEAVSIPTLTFLSGDALGKEFPLIQEQVTLGRGQESDILIMDPSVSRQHVRLTCRKLLRRDGSQRFKVVLVDLGGRNGTLVNYRRVRRVVLKPGDKIALGRVILKFEYRDLADQSFHQQIYRLATEDNLTGLLNRYAISRVLSEELTKRLRYQGKVAVLLIDVDEFKSLNDTRGHLTGDRALQEIGAVLRSHVRRQDRAGRFGGEEFVVVLPETGMKGAMSVAERIRSGIERSVAAALSLTSPITASIGVASFPEDGGSVETLLDHADAAVYRAKAKGKNRVELYKQTRTSTKGA